MSTITASMVKELREITGSAMMDCKKALTESAGDLEAAKEILRKKGQVIAAKKSSRETKEGLVRIFSNDEAVCMIRLACETDFVARNDKFIEFADTLGAIALEHKTTENFSEVQTSGGTVAQLIINAVAELGENIYFAEGQYWGKQESTLIGSYIHSNQKIGVLVEIATEGKGNQPAVQELGRNIAMHVAASQFVAISEDKCPPEVLEKEKQFLIQQAQDSGKPPEIIEKMILGRINKFLKEICLLTQPYVKDPDTTIEKLVQDTAQSSGFSALSVERVYKAQF